MFTPTGYEISPDSAALVVVDMQNDFVAAGAPYENEIGRAAVARINGVAAECRGRGIPVIFTAQAHRADGSDLGRVRELHPLTAEGRALKQGTQGVELYEALEIEPHDHLINKHRFSAFYETDLDELLKKLGIRLLIVAGVAANVCVESTVRDAFFRDYEVVVLADAVGPAALSDRGWGTFDEDVVGRYVLTTISTFFGEVSTSDDVLRRIRNAGSPSAVGQPSSRRNPGDP